MPKLVIEVWNIADCFEVLGIQCFESPALPAASAELPFDFAAFATATSVNLAATSRSAVLFFCHFY